MGNGMSVNVDDAAAVKAHASATKVYPYSTYKMLDAATAASNKGVPTAFYVRLAQLPGEVFYGSLSCLDTGGATTWRTGLKVTVTGPKMYVKLGTNAGLVGTVT